MSSSFHKLAGTVLAATATLGVLAPVLEAKATPSPGEENWVYVSNSETQPCVPQFSVDFQFPERVIVIDQRDSCPVSTQLHVILANDRRELRLIAHSSQKYSGRWVTQANPVAQGGLYRVMGVEYLNGQMAPPLDQRITIPFAQQEQSASTPPPVVLPPAPRQQEPHPEPFQAQGNGQKTLLDVAWCVYGKLGHIIWNGWKTDFSSLEVCFSR
jgi:hypothetical protein